MVKKFRHSHFVRVNYNGTPANLTVYPNPVIEQLSVHLNSFSGGSVIIELLTEDGHSIDRQDKHLESGVNSIDFDVQAQNARKYVLKIANSQLQENLTPLKGIIHSA